MKLRLTYLTCLRLLHGSSYLAPYWAAWVVGAVVVVAVFQLILGDIQRRLGRGIGGGSGLEGRAILLKRCQAVGDILKGRKK